MWNRCKAYEKNGKVPLFLRPKVEGNSNTTEIGLTLPSFYSSHVYSTLPAEYSIPTQCISCPLISKDEVIMIIQSDIFFLAAMHLKQK